MVHNIGTIRKNGLFDNLMKQLLDEGAMGVIVIGRELGNVPRPAQLDHFPLICQIFGHRIDRFAIVHVAEFSNRVEMFEAEPKRIDEGMTTLAVAIFGQLHNFFTHR